MLFTGAIMRCDRSCFSPEPSCGPMDHVLLRKLRGSGKLLLLYKDDGRPAEGRSNAHKTLVDQARCVDVDDQADGVQAGAAHNDRDSDQEAGAAVRGPVFPAGASDRFFLPAAEDFDETGKGVDAGQINHQVEQ